MKKKIYTIICLAVAFAATWVSCDEAEVGIEYVEMPLSVENIKWRSDVNAEDREVISQLIENMVRVENCKFYMGAQCSALKRPNYMSGFTYRDTVWYEAERDVAYHYNRSKEDTIWYEPASLAFADTLKNKHGNFPYALIYKNQNGYKVGPVVTVSMDDYYIGKYEITQGEWMAVMHRLPTGRYCIVDSLSGTNAWYEPIGKGSRVAAYNIWHEDALAFCDTLSKKTGLSFCLPTEAQWECAARGGRYARGYKYPGAESPSEAGWIWSNARTQGIGNDDYGIHTVGELLPNELGIYDMCGNVSEWVSNGYYAYDLRDNNNPIGKELLNNGTDTLVLRGGSWMQEKVMDFCVSNRKHCIVSSYSSEQSRQSAFVNCGFRIVLPVH